MNRLNEFVGRNPMAALASAGAAGFALGFGACYIYINRDAKEYLDDIEEEESPYEQLEIPLIRERFETVKIDPKPIERKESEVVLNERRDPSEIEVEEPQIVNIFHSKEGDGWDWDEERKFRERTSEDGIGYIIHRDEFFNEESGYSQSTLTYYAGDEILVDEQEVPIYNHKAIVGELRFGHGSSDSNVVYIRNDRLKGEYEVIKDDGSYEIEVLGQQFEAAVSSSDRRGVPKFRDE